MHRLALWSTTHSPRVIASTRAVGPHEATTHAAGHELAHLCEQPPRRRRPGCPSHLRAPGSRGLCERVRASAVLPRRATHAPPAPRTRRRCRRSVADLAEGIVGALRFGGELDSLRSPPRGRLVRLACRWPIVRREGEASALISQRRGERRGEAQALSARHPSSSVVSVAADSATSVSAVPRAATPAAQVTTCPTSAAAHHRHPPHPYAGHQCLQRPQLRGGSPGARAPACGESSTRTAWPTWTWRRVTCTSGCSGARYGALLDHLAVAQQAQRGRGRRGRHGRRCASAARGARRRTGRAATGGPARNHPLTQRKTSRGLKCRGRRARQTTARPPRRRGWRQSSCDRTLPICPNCARTTSACRPRPVLPSRLE